MLSNQDLLWYWEDSKNNLESSSDKYFPHSEIDILSSNSENEADVINDVDRLKWWKWESCRPTGS